MTAITETYLESLFISEGIDINKFAVKPTVLKAMKSYKNNLKVAKKVLKDHNIDADALMKKGKATASKFKSIKDKKRAQSLLIKEITDAVGYAFKSGITAEDMEQFGKDILKSLGVLAVLLFVSGFMSGMTLLISGPTLGTIIGAIVLAPLFEEFGKRIAVKGNYPWTYTAIFAGFEGVSYLVSLVVIGGMPMGSAVALRGMAFIMHFFTTYTQKIYEERSEQVHDEDVSLQGYWIGVVMHATFNTFGLVYHNVLGNLV